MSKSITPAIDLFWPKVERDPDTGCWNWTAKRSSWGYGVFSLRHRECVSAHRWSYEHFIGDIPEGLTIDHLCRNRACVNPEHMEPVTMRENTMRGFGITSINARKTHCIHGHEFTSENTFFEANGHRACRVCRRRIWTESNARRRSRKAPCA